MFSENVTRIGLLLLFATIIPCVFSAGTVIVCLLTRVKFQKVATGRQFVAIIFDKLESSPILAYGVFVAKATACHFLPFAVMPGGRLLIELTKKREESVLAKILN